MSVVFVLLAAGSAFAVTYDCHKSTCYGTNNADTIDGTGIDQTYFGKDGRDILSDTVGDDRDTIYGDAGNDRLNDADGDGRDTLRGGPGYDVCIGDRNDEFRSCEDTIIR
jgi:Ca2+-binding RTX toxin-like protein